MSIDAADYESSQRALAEQKRVLASVIEQMSDGIVMADQGGRMRLFNGPARRILGQGMTDEPPERWTEVYGLLLPDAKTPFPAAEFPLARALRGESSDAVEMISRSPRRGDVYLSVSGRPIIRDDKTQSGGVIVFQDITTRKMLERSRRELLHHVHHELRSPISVASLALELLNETEPGSFSAEQKSFLEMAVRSSRQLARLSEDLLDATRAETGKLSVTPQPLELATATRELVDELRLSAQRKKIALDFAAEPGTPSALADPIRIRQVIGNLIENALKFTPHGGKVSVCVARANGAGVRVTVADSGPGLSKADREMIFERLYQADNQDQASQRGLGLGLHIAKELIRAHGGTIGVESEPGRGCSFSVTVPQA